MCESDKRTLILKVLAVSYNESNFRMALWSHAVIVSGCIVHVISIVAMVLKQLFVYAVHVHMYTLGGIRYCAKNMFSFLCAVLLPHSSNFRYPAPAPSVVDTCVW